MLELLKMVGVNQNEIIEIVNLMIKGGCVITIAEVINNIIHKNNVEKYGEKEVWKTNKLCRAINNRNSDINNNN